MNWILSLSVLYFINCCKDKMGMGKAMHTCLSSMGASWDKQKNEWIRKLFVISIFFMLNTYLYNNNELSSQMRTQQVFHKHQIIRSGFSGSASGIISGLCRFPEATQSGSYPERQSAESKLPAPKFAARYTNPLSYPTMLKTIASSSILHSSYKGKVSVQQY